MRLRFDFVYAALAASLVFLIFAAAHAQTASTTPAPSTTATTTATAAPVSDVVAVPVWPKTAVTLPELPVAASFGLGQVEGIAPDLLSGVTAKGFARKVAVEGQTIGQVLVLSVVKGDREEAISTEGLTAQFDAGETSELFPEKTVEVKGSKAALVAALEKLAAPAVKDDEEKRDTDTVSDNPVSSGTSNDEASSYQTPTVSAATEEEEEPVVDYRTTRDGCPVRPDLVQEKAFVQSKVQTFTDGALSGEGDCSDSEISYPLKKSFASCPTDKVDFDVLTAWPQFQWYYVDDAGENHPIGECLTDEETAYTITEDEGQCPIFLDFTAEQAVPQSAFVYLGRNNALTQVPGKGCAPSTKTAAVAMTESTAACPMRPDYVANRSYELSMWTYVLKGVTYQAAPCADTSRSFTHEIVYADSAGNYICPAINTNMTTKKVTLQSRRRIVVDGVPQWVTDCTPDTSSQDILATTDGCMNPSKWTHDLDANISYGQERFYYKKVDGTPEYVTACQNSTVTYPHDVTVTGYQNHDDQLWAYPLSTVTISVGGSPYTVASSEVLPGAAQWAYVLNGTVDQKTGNSSYEGCDAYRETARFEQWQRPDESIYLKQISAGTPEGPVDVCTTSIIKDQDLIVGYYAFTYHYGDATVGTCPLVDGLPTQCSVWGRIIDRIQKTAIKNTETGEETYSCAMISHTRAQDGSGNRGSVPSTPYPHYDDEWGWDYRVLSTGYVGPYPVWPVVPPCPAGF